MNCTWMVTSFSRDGSSTYELVSWLPSSTVTNSHLCIIRMGWDWISFHGIVTKSCLLWIEYIIRGVVNDVYIFAVHSWWVINFLIWYSTSTLCNFWTKLKSSRKVNVKRENSQAIICRNIIILSSISILETRMHSSRLRSDRCSGRH